MKAPSITQLRDGPPSVDLLTAAAALGIGRTRAYELARAGAFPVTLIRIGSKVPGPGRRAALPSRHQRELPWLLTTSRFPVRNHAPPRNVPSRCAAT